MPCNELARTTTTRTTTKTITSAQVTWSSLAVLSRTCVPWRPFIGETPLQLRRQGTRAAHCELVFREQGTLVQHRYIRGRQRQFTKRDGRSEARDREKQTNKAAVYKSFADARGWDVPYSCTNSDANYKNNKNARSRYYVHPLHAVRLRIHTPPLFPIRCHHAEGRITRKRAVYTGPRNARMNTREMGQREREREGTGLKKKIIMWKKTEQAFSRMTEKTISKTKQCLCTTSVHTHAHAPRSKARPASSEARLKQAFANAQG